MKVKYVILLTFFIFSCNEEEKKNITIQKNQNDESLNDNPRNIIKEVNEITLKSENSILKDVKVYDLKRNSYSLKEIIGDSTKIIFRFSDSQCNTCIEHSIKYIKKIERQIGIDNIIMIGDFKNRNSLSVFIRLNSDINQKVYNYTDNFQLSVESTLLPYIFTMNSSLKVENIFVPLKEIPERTNKYFENIQEKFQFDFNKNI